MENKNVSKKGMQMKRPKLQPDNGWRELDGNGQTRLGDKRITKDPRTCVMAGMQLRC